MASSQDAASASRGTYAEYAVLTSGARTPAGLDLVEAGSYPVPVETASRSLDQLGDPAAALAQVAALIADGKLRIGVQEAFSLETAAKAHDASHAGHVTGRFIIAV